MCKNKITTVCYGMKEMWNSREKAKAHFLEAMMNSDGSEQSRYTQVYMKLACGLDYCTDEEDN